MTETRETESNAEYVTLTDRASNKSVDLPLLSGTEGPKVIDAFVEPARPSDVSPLYESKY